MILIEHATVLTLDAERRILSDGSVLVDGRDIVQVGPAALGACAATARSSDRRPALRGRAPASSTPHVHFTEHLSRGLMLDDIPVPRYLPDWLLPLVFHGHAGRGAGGRAAGLRRDDPHRDRPPSARRARSSTWPRWPTPVEQVGMRAVLGRWTWDLEGQRGRMKQTTDEALALTADVLGKVNGRADGRLGAWPLLLGFGTCSEALIQGAHALAASPRRRLGDDAERARIPRDRAATRYRSRALDALGVLDASTKLAHMVYVDDADIALLARRGVKISPLPDRRAQAAPRGWPPTRRFPEMVDAGVCVSLGGDSGNGSNHFDMLRLMYLAATVYKDARIRRRRAAGRSTCSRWEPFAAPRRCVLDREDRLDRGRASGPISCSTTSTRRSGGPLLNPVNNLVYAASGASVPHRAVIDGRVVLDEGRLDDAGRARALRARRAAEPRARATRRRADRHQMAGGPVSYFRAVDPFPLESADYTKLHEFYTRLGQGG